MRNSEIQDFIRKHAKDENSYKKLIARYESRVESFVEKSINLYQANEELDRFFTLSNEIICVITLDGYFYKINPAWKNSLGWSPEEILNKNVFEFVHPKDHLSTLKAYKKAIDGKDVTAFENRCLTKNSGYRWLSWNAIRFEEDNFIYASARDITNQKQTTQELIRAKETAESASRIKSAFLANMSHEIRTPLNSVIGFANILLKNKDNHLDPKELMYTERIVANGKHLLELINDVLDLAKIEAGRISVSWSEINLNELIKEIINEVESQAKTRNLELILDMKIENINVLSDKRKLKQILINLLGNAIKFTEKGSVTVRVISKDDITGSVLIEIIDTGIGIPQDKLVSIFDPFERVDKAEEKHIEGSGLGLAITKTLCDMLGCELNVESQVENGTKFSILIFTSNILSELVAFADEQLGEEK